MAGRGGGARRLLVALILATAPAWSACQRGPATSQVGTAAPTAGRLATEDGIGKPAGTGPHPSPSATASATATPSPAASATPTPAQYPRPPATPVGGYHLDSPGGRIYASIDGHLRVYATADGGLLASERLLPDEALLGVDAAGERLYVWSWQSEVLRVLAAEDRRELDRMGLAGMRPRNYPFMPSLADPHGSFKPRSHASAAPSQRPLLRRGSGELLVIDDTWLRAYRPEGGEARLAWSVDLGEYVKGIRGLHLTEDGRLLYLQRREAPVTEAYLLVPSEIVALSLPSGRLVGRATGSVQLAVWGWGNDVFATDSAGNWINLEYLWRFEDGRVRRRLASNDGPPYSTLDSRRRHLIHRMTPEIVALVDADTLEISHLSSWSWLAEPVLYDIGTDQMFSVSTDGLGLQAIPAAAFETVVASTAVAPVVTAVALHDFPLVVEGKRDPSLRLGRSHATTPAPDSGQPSPHEDDPNAISRDGGSTWTLEPPGGLGRWPARLIASANFTQNQTLFSIPQDLGVWRSRDAGRSWQPVSKGLDTRSIRMLHLAPQTEALLFAELELGHGMGPGMTTGLWRSRDGGDSWKQLDSYRSLSFAPDYARSQMILGFRGPNAFVSSDGGDTWERRGRMPSVKQSTGVVGTSFMIPDSDAPYPAMLAIATTHSLVRGDLHWPESGTRLLASTDGGWTWDVTWLPDHEDLMEAMALGWEGRLVGPVSAKDESDDRRVRWYLVVNDRVTLELGLPSDLRDDEENDQVRASQRHLPAHPNAVPIAPAGPGRLLVFDRESHEAFEVAVDEFERGAP